MSFSPETPELGFASRAVRAGQVRTQEGEHAEPIFLTSSFVFADAAEAATRFSTATGNIYSRFTNPTVRVFQERLATLEGGESCIATGSGMAAILATCMALLKSGDHIVSANAVFGTTVSLFNQYLSKFGVATTYVPLSDLAAWEAAIQSVLSACKEFKVACGYPANATDVEKRMQQGFSVFVIGWGEAGFKTIDIGRGVAGR